MYLCTRDPNRWKQDPCKFKLVTFARVCLAMACDGNTAQTTKAMLSDMPVGHEHFVACVYRRCFQLEDECASSVPTKLARSCAGPQSTKTSCSHSFDAEVKPEILHHKPIKRAQWRKSYNWLSSRIPPQFLATEVCANRKPSKHIKKRITCMPAYLCFTALMWTGENLS